MIVPTLGKVGHPVTFTGYADDYGTKIVAIEFSLDNGENWTRHETADASPDLWVHWTFTYTPEKVGSYQLKVRSVNEDGKTSPVSAVAELIVEEDEKA